MIKRNKLVSIALNKAMKVAFRLNQETGDRVHVYRQGSEFVTCFDGEIGQYTDSHRFHATIEDGVIIDEG